MKRLISLIVAVAIGISFATSVYAQTEEMAGVDETQPEHKGMHRMMHPSREEKGIISAKELSQYDEATKEAWREIQGIRIKGKANIYFAIAAAMAISISVLGGAIGQGKVAAAAMEGIARNPDASAKIFTPLIVSMALIESLVIYALVIAFLLQGKM